MGRRFRGINALLTLAEKRVRSPVFIVSVFGVVLAAFVLLVGTSAHAQVIDGYEFGKKAGVTVRLATQLDYMMQICQGQKNSLYLNQVDFVLRRINGRSAQRVKENAARASQISVGAVNRLAQEEVEQVLSQYGGCNSSNYQTLFRNVSSYFDEHMKYLANVAQMTERSGGRNLID